MGWSVSGSGPVQNPGAMGIYQQQLGAMTKNYQNVLAGYSQAQNNLSSGLGEVAAGYGGVRNAAMNRLGLLDGGWGVAAPAAKDIQRQFTQTQGANQQALISAGLGNSSLLAQSNNQAAEFAGNSYAKLGSDLASTAAGVETQVGLAGLAARQQGLGMQSSLASSYLGNLAGYNFAPRVDLFGQQSNSRSDTGGGGGGGGGHGGGGSSGGGLPWGMESAWANRYGAPNSLGLAQGYSQPNYWNGGYAGPNMQLGGGYQGGYDGSDLAGEDF